jgi:peptidyl-prolyl cis-trans isomerase SurA
MRFGRLLPVLLLLGCASRGEPPAASPSPTASPPSVVEGAGETAERIAASHVLVAFQGSAAQSFGVRRTREEAHARALEVLKLAREGQDFADLARRYSDDPSGARGGFLGGFARGAMTPAFEEAAFALSPRGISDVVESPYGFHVIRRDPLNEVHVAHILVQWRGIEGVRVERSKDEARIRAEEAHARLLEGLAFDEAARLYSDGPMASRGGDLGWFARGQFRPDFEDAAFALQPGALSPVFETAVGYHIVKRVE